MRQFLRLKWETEGVAVFTNGPSELGMLTGPETPTAGLNFSEYKGKKTILALVGGFTPDDRGDHVATLDVEILGHHEFPDRAKRNFGESMSRNPRRNQGKGPPGLFGQQPKPTHDEIIRSCWSLPR